MLASISAIAANQEHRDRIAGAIGVIEQFKRGIAAAANHMQRVIKIIIKIPQRFP
jgi:hypothetical protein